MGDGLLGVGDSFLGTRGLDGEGMRNDSGDVLCASDAFTSVRSKV